MEFIIGALAASLADAKKRGNTITLSPTPTTFTSTTNNPTPANFVADVDITRAPSSAPTAAPLTDWQIGLISVAVFIVAIVILGTYYRMSMMKASKATNEADPLIDRPTEDPAGETTATWQDAHQKPTVLPGPPVSSV